MTNPLYGTEERPTPQWREYFEGVRKVQPTKKRREMLSANYRAPNHTITATEMTQQIWNRPGHGTANLHYGTLARDIAKQMGIVIPPDEQAVNFLVSFANTKDGRWIWTLHPELVEALRIYHIDRKQTVV